MLVKLKFQLILSKSQEIAFPQINYISFWNAVVRAGTVCVEILLNELPFYLRVSTFRYYKFYFRNQFVKTLSKYHCSK